MQQKSSAHYQREYRKRLREQGFVKKEVWVLPENARQLAIYEQQLRLPPTAAVNNRLGLSESVKGEMEMNESNLQQHAPWTTASLYEALLGTDPVASGRVGLELIEGVSPALHIVMNECGDLPVFLTVSGEQILVESLLWPASDVKDVAQFNEAVLRTHKFFPLSTISLDKIDGEDCYHMFGALSSQSSLHNILFEIEVLASNVIQATQAYAEFLLNTAE